MALTVDGDRHTLRAAAFVRRNAGTLRTPEDTKLGGPPAAGEAARLTDGAATSSPAEDRWRRIHQNDIEVSGPSPRLGVQ